MAVPKPASKGVVGMKITARMGLLGCLMAGAMAAVKIGRKSRRISFKGLSVVITGGSRGLGLELARLFAGEGARLALVARDVEELERAGLELEAAGAEVHIYQCDVGNQEDVERTVQAIIGECGRVDVLINNAGIVQVAPFENFAVQDFKEAMDTHAWGALYMIRSIAPLMKRQGGGRIVNISSIGGLVAVPHLLPYSMSKFALTALSDGLRSELAKDGILVTTVAPGLMRTGSHIHALLKGQYQKEYAWFSISDANPLLSAHSRRAAKQIVNACRYGAPRLIITLPAALLHLLNANFSGLTTAATRLAARMLPSPVLGHSSPQTGLASGSWAAPSFLTRLADKASLHNNELPIKGH
ncbi:SDR family oxidoreductase [Geobacter chapellei]|uniref:SDR family oxidoreductase n=2 Tax=Pelotalea chapellei TaxID=44671 RepID=A0ABS5U519_9BACT|nr:SDR family oxidoreductase [Pelotalea chapellei]